MILGSKIPDFLPSRLQRASLASVKFTGLHYFCPMQMDKKKKQNLAEYIIYLWRTEDLLRFKGYLQIGGYRLYEKFGQQPGIPLVGCMARSGGPPRPPKV